MSTPHPYLVITSTEFVDNARLVYGAFGLGFGSIATALVDKDGPNAPTTTPTGYCMFDESATSDIVGALQALVGGDVPGLDKDGNPILWGESGIISQADAIATFAHPNVQIISAVGWPMETIHTWRAATVDAKGYAVRVEAD